jgi:hypothetical protein
MQPTISRMGEQVRVCSQSAQSQHRSQYIVTACFFLATDYSFKCFTQPFWCLFDATSRHMHVRVCSQSAQPQHTSQNLLLRARFWPQDMFFSALRSHSDV